MKNILLPIDLYADPSRVIRQVLSFLKGVEGNFKLFLLVTYMVPVSSSVQIINTHDELRSQSMERLKKELERTKEFSTYGKISFETVSQMGMPANVIYRIVKEKNIDVVIVGMKQDVIFNLLNQIHCPVVVLPFLPS